MPQYWLMKSEPDELSIRDLQRLGQARWDGVRNYQARNFVNDETNRDAGFGPTNSVGGCLRSEGKFANTRPNKLMVQRLLIQPFYRSKRPTDCHFPVCSLGNLRNTVGRLCGSSRLTISPAGLW